MTSASISLRRARPLLGTFVEITASGRSGARVESAIEAAFVVIETIQRLMSFHDPDSDVSRLNREACHRPVAVHPWTFEVVKTASELHKHSCGAFDIAVAPVLQDLGLLPIDSGVTRGGDLHATTKSISLLADRRIRYLKSGVVIDLGGIAKGFAVDRALDVLRNNGMDEALVNAGGDLACFGEPAKAVHIRHPVTPEIVLCEVDIENEALASSACRAEPTMAPEMTMAAIIEPGTRRPVEAVVAASVRAPTCMIADALTKIVMIQGTASGSLLRSYQASALLVLQTGALLTTVEWGVARHAA